MKVSPYAQTQKIPNVGGKGEINWWGSKRSNHLNIFEKCLLVLSPILKSNNDDDSWLVISKELKALIYLSSLLGESSTRLQREHYSHVTTGIRSPLLASWMLSFTGESLGFSQKQAHNFYAFFHALERVVKTFSQDGNIVWGLTAREAGCVPHSAGRSVVCGMSVGLCRCLSKKNLIPLGQSDPYCHKVWAFLMWRKLRPK